MCLHLRRQTVSSSRGVQAEGSAANIPYIIDGEFETMRDAMICKSSFTCSVQSLGPKTDLPTFPQTESFKRFYI